MNDNVNTDIELTELSKLPKKLELKYLKIKNL